MIVDGHLAFTGGLLSSEILCDDSEKSGLPLVSSYHLDRLRDTRVLFLDQYDVDVDSFIGMKPEGDLRLRRLCRRHLEPYGGKLSIFLLLFVKISENFPRTLRENHTKSHSNLSAICVE